MNLPDCQSHPAALAKHILESEAIRLFVERAGASQAFSVNDDNAGAVAQICVRLDGIPLALELAAAWANVLAPNRS
jgi:predicted ATPase